MKERRTALMLAPGELCDLTHRSSSLRRRFSKRGWWPSVVTHSIISPMDRVRAPVRAAENLKVDHVCRAPRIRMSCLAVKESTALQLVQRGHEVSRQAPPQMTSPADRICQNPGHLCRWHRKKHTLTNIYLNNRYRDRLTLVNLF